MIAKEARYHNTCRRDYVRRDDRPHHTVTSEEDAQSRRESRMAHEATFNFLCDHVQSSILSQGHVERMTMLLDRYQQFMQQNFAQHYNDSYTTQSLKIKLVTHFGDKLTFWLPQPRNKSELV